MTNNGLECDLAAIWLRWLRSVRRSKCDGHPTAGGGSLERQIPPDLHRLTDLHYFALDSAGEDLGGFGHQCVELVHENQVDLSAGLAAQKHRKTSENNGFRFPLDLQKNGFRTIQIITVVSCGHIR